MRIGFIDTSYTYEEAIAESNEAKEYGVILIPSHYKEVLTDFTSPYQIWYGSRVSAKTYVKALQYLYKAVSQPYFRGLFTRETQKDARETQFQLFEDLITKIYPFLQDEFVIEKTSMCVRHIKTGHFMKGASFEDMPRSLTEYTDFWVDEPITRNSSITRDDLLDISGTLRNSYGMVTQKHMTFNPISTKTFIYEDFFGENKVFEASILKANYEHNIFAPPEKIIEFESYKSFDYKRYLVDTLGEWGVITPKSPAVQTFDVSKHVGKVKAVPNVALLFWVDFNNSPLACTIWQIYRDNGNFKIRGIREIKIEKKEGKTATTQLIEHIRLHYNDKLHTICFSGDATSKTDKTEGLANWTQIENAFKLGSRRLQVPTSNPSVLNSLELLDYVFYNCDVVLDESMTTTIFEIMHTEKDDKGLVKKDRTKPEQRADFLDTIRYGFNYWFMLKDNMMKFPSKFGIKA